MNPDASDEELLAAFARGDPGGFERLLRRHRVALFTFLLRLLGDRARAEDLSQETWLRVVNGAETWREQARFTSWLYSIARNLCVDQSRRDRLRRTESLEGDPAGGDRGQPILERLIAPEPDPEAAAAGAELEPILLRALASLPEEQREVFVLREHAGLAFKEIAALMGANENTVRSRMRYALEGMREGLEEAGVSAADEMESARQKVGSR